MSSMDEYEAKLQYCLNRAIDNPPKIQDPVAGWIDIITKARTKAVLAVTTTSILKKCVNPTQDIRQHQANMPGGYSGRGLDTRTVTPFLKTNGFSAMRVSGWLTRSLEQRRPYNLKYPGVVSEPGLKDAFLHLLDVVEKGKVDPQDVLTGIFVQLVDLRELEQVRLAKPTGLTIQEIIRRLDKHFASGGRGKSRLPTLAVYAAYKQLVGKRGELSRYRHMELRELESHTTADTRSGATGDIEIVDPDTGRVFEAVEIKHGQAITTDMVRTAYDKFRSEPVTRYYLLATVNTNEWDEITQEVIRIQREHGCQVIVNGVLDTIKYYLRLLKNPDDFVTNYVALVESDQTIKYAHKMAWNNIVTVTN